MARGGTLAEDGKTGGRVENRGQTNRALRRPPRAAVGDGVERRRTTIHALAGKAKWTP